MILLTGATGTIGRAAMHALHTAGVPFKVAVRSGSRAAVKAETVRFDWDDLSSYQRAMEGVEHLFLLTPNSERQVGYVLQAIATAKRAGVKHIVRLSVMGADADPGIILERQHFAAEREVKASGIAWTILRPTFFMDNLINYYGVVPTRDSTVYLPNGDGKAAWADPADIGEVVAKVLTHDGYAGKVYELTGPDPLSTAEALQVMSEELGHKYTYVNVTEEAARKAQEDSGMPAWLVDALMELHSLVRLHHASTLADGVQQVLGRPPHALREWAARLRLQTAGSA
ncbi:SDR family oxidoreductase [Massilia horti]|uniref:SDR family oxidoreductase n=1 Tax=Massilia horti TaxID=2562153 RepID=A0A4Y9SN90_9BURK|nr:SDR family oxidoreductase [Massilia horti]TFW28115.1 SDR family oxidoreductase [Massilia horti]TFW28130.1 SDR family oxidoreductase [Massilia horti]